MCCTKDGLPTSTVEFLLFISEAAMYSACIPSHLWQLTVAFVALAAEVAG